MVGESRYNIQDFEAAISQGYGFNYLTDMRNNTQVIVLDLQPSLKFPDVTGLVRKPSL